MVMDVKDLPVVAANFIFFWYTTAKFKLYFNRYRWFFNVLVFCIIIMTAISLYIWGNDGLEFCSIWGTSAFLGLINGMTTYIKDDLETISEPINLLDKIAYFIGLSLGVFTLLLPNMTDLYYLIGGGRDLKIDLVVHITFRLAGASFILFNKVTIKWLKKAVGLMAF